MKIFTRKKTSIDKETILILYGTKSGNARQIASEAENYYSKRGLPVVSKSMAHTTPRELLQVKEALFIVSTYDEGKPPVSARKFYKQLHKPDFPDMQHLSYAVCALGDSSYNTFCTAGVTIDKRLRQLKASPFMQRTDCDSSFAKVAAKWIKGSYASLANEKINNASTNVQLSHFNNVGQYSGKIEQRIRLYNDINGNSCYHLELAVNDNKLKFNPGDAVEIKPVNPGWLTELICRHIGDYTILEQIKKEKEICRLSLGVLNKYVTLTGNKELLLLLTDSNKTEHYKNKANVLDLIVDYPSGISGAALLNLLPDLKGRQYSIANSSRLVANKIHLSIKTLRFEFNNSRHEGVASVYTNELLEMGSEVKFKLISNADFHLHKTADTPVILIANGTGIAPVRAFLQDFVMTNRKNKIWLLWGLQKHEITNKYSQEFNALFKKDYITRLDLVASRVGEVIGYVQDKFMEQKDLLQSCLEENATIYVCGSKQMEKAVRKNLQKVLVGTFTSTVEVLEENGRYITDVY